MTTHILETSVRAPAETDKAWRFEWITSWDEVWAPKFQSRWIALLQDCSDAHVYFHPSMVRAWLETFRPIFRIEPRFVVGRSGGNTVFFPLVAVRLGWKDLGHRLIAPVGYIGFDYHDPLMVGHASPDVWSHFWRDLEVELLERWGGTFDVCSLFGIRTQCQPEDLAWSQAHQVEIVRIGGANNNVAPYVDISGYASVDEFMRGRSKNLRHSLQRRIRRLKELGDVTYHVYAPSELDDCRRAMWRALRASYKRYPMTWRLGAFHDNLISMVFPTGLLEISEVRVGGNAVAWQMSFVYRNSYYAFMASFEESFADYAPGKIHTYMCLADAIERGLTTFDLGAGYEPYKLEWADGHTELFGLTWTGDGVLARVRTSWATRGKPKLVQQKRRLRNLLESIRGLQPGG